MVLFVFQLNLCFESEFNLKKKNLLNNFLFFKYQAVKRSRVKQKERASETKGRVNNLKTENTKLEGRIEQKEKELKLLKGLFLEAAQIKSNSHPHLNLQKLLQDKDNDDDDDASTAGT